MKLKLQIVVVAFFVHVALSQGTIPKHGCVIKSNFNLFPHLSQLRYHLRGLDYFLLSIPHRTNFFSLQSAANDTFSLELWVGRMHQRIHGLGKCHFDSQAAKEIRCTYVAAPWSGTNGWWRRHIVWWTDVTDLGILLCSPLFSVRKQACKATLFRKLRWIDRYKIFSVPQKVKLNDWVPRAGEASILES